MARGRRIPFYYIAKLAFVIWLQAPQTRVRARGPRAAPHCAACRLCAVLTCRLSRAQGASVLQVHYITPLLHKHENAIDSVLEESIKKARAAAPPAAIQDASSDSALLAGRSHDLGVPHAQRTLLPGASLQRLHSLRQIHKADVVLYA